MTNQMEGCGCVKLTERALRIVRHAEREAEEKAGVVQPVHVLLGVLLERTGVCGELYLKHPDLVESVKKLSENQYVEDVEGETHELFTLPVASSTKRLLTLAVQRMQRYGQVYINEGHLVDALFKLEDPLVNAIMKAIDLSPVAETIARPRDMIVSLRSYTFPELPQTNLSFRRATIQDAVAVKDFVEHEFGSGWLDSVTFGFGQQNIPIFIALQEGEVIGFASYDVVRAKKGVFGPMGTSLSSRVQGVGYTLLHLSLREMQEIGYEYAVIGEAGPMEFYEKACGAVVIPKGDPVHNSKTLHSSTCG